MDVVRDVPDLDHTHAWMMTSSCRRSQDQLEFVRGDDYLVEDRGIVERPVAAASDLCLGALPKRDDVVLAGLGAWVEEPVAVLEVRVLVPVAAQSCVVSRSPSLDTAAIVPACRAPMPRRSSSATGSVSSSSAAR